MRPAVVHHDRREREGARDDRNGIQTRFREQGLRWAAMFRKTQHIHLVGIGGAGMSGIAEVLLTLGYKVSGSDLSQSETTRRLEELGGRIATGHHESNIGEAQVVVISSAVSATNPEVVAAKAKQIPVIPRAEMLAELMRLKFGVAIAGAHGKTTTTSMVATVLAQGGLDPTMVIGGKVNALGSHARLGRGDLLIAEADESDGSFLRLSPTIVAVTNIDREHLEHYGTMERLNDGFLEFINKVPFYGLAVLCADDERLRNLFPRVVKRYQTYGLQEQAGYVPDFRATDISLKQWGSEFRAFFRGRSLGPFRLGIPGIHNVSNALIAIAIGVELDIPVDLIRKGLAAFTGVERRFHLRGEKAGIMVIDDYGHHPTEVKATIAAAKQGWDRRVVVLFQPHRYTRSRDLMQEFAHAFDQADLLFMTEIYAAGEQPIPGVSGEKLVEAVRAGGHPSATFVERKESLAEQVLPALKAGDLVITLGAGDIWKSGLAILERLPAAS
ncbi:MAG: UDP-N-acetylmuramate--L-alanine ligase [Nitrospirae bacterium]|nr:MAG: UDP-N-acetylmuramate-L-alanine ligase [Nitrospira sp. OLB3]MBV6471098.1 UDP-N-acetylmuramate--L-alanine ligase [Nitrospirota bacterium]MCK6493592.1 UDP-N-acetylmuramate--L-alanine ligase [Nitrospira sp.]MCK6498007.1 UDP-N-acetylmuramate--L-alanine ligase [Nitrospira sp.]MEB2339002.1 UDP-N-acetylmuramate--L-alanine ligase [Nitrospirales bacterium]